MKKNFNDLGELFHNFSLFDVKNKIKKNSNFDLNQKCKEPIIKEYIRHAIEKSKKNQSDNITFTELFCADGYYAFLAKKMGATKCYGVDDNKKGYARYNNIIAKRLGFKDIEFIKDDVNNINKFKKTDIVANLGGLYHIKNPKEILIKSYNMAKKFLIIQTVVSIENNSPNYFEVPSPGRNWGCRFSKQWLDKLLKELNYKIIKQDFNELKNEKLYDKGSAYYLIKVNKK